MPKFMIERSLPGAGSLPASQLREVAAKSNAVLRELGPDVQWLESFITPDKIYCVYTAKNPEIVREHARRGGFPADSVSEVLSVIDPTTAEAR